MTEPKDPPRQKAGYLILRLKPGEGFVIGKDVEVRLASKPSEGTQDAEIAVRAPKEVPIKRVK